MTIYEKELVKAVEGRYGDLTTGQLVEQLIKMGVVDFTRCKVLAVRECVEKLVGMGHKKVDSMWMAAEKFCCSYEYVRKCVYYYKDINFN